MPTSGKALQRAVKLDSIPSNPAAQVALPKARKFRDSYYTPEELQQLFCLRKGNEIGNSGFARCQKLLGKEQAV